MLYFIWGPDPLFIEIKHLLLIFMVTKNMQFYIIKVFTFLTTWLTSGHYLLVLSQWEIFCS